MNTPGGGICKRVLHIRSVRAKHTRRIRLALLIPPVNKTRAHGVLVLLSDFPYAFRPSARYNYRLRGLCSVIGNVLGAKGAKGENRSIQCIP